MDKLGRWYKFGFMDYSKVDKLDAWYKFVNLGGKTARTSKKSRMGLASGMPSQNVGYAVFPAPEP